MQDKIGIISTGSYVSNKVVTNAELEGALDTTDTWIQERTGIRERRIADKEETTSQMASKAAKMAITRSGLKPEEIELIIVGTSTPDMFFPSTACLVQKNISANNAVAFDVMAACSGFIYALHTARSFIQAGIYRNALVIGAEKMSAILDWTDRTTCVLFGDGAGACLLNKMDDDRGIIATDIGSCGEKAELLYVPAVGMNYVDAFKVVSTDKQEMRMDGKGVFKFAVNEMYQSIQKVLKQADKRIDEIDIFIPHQANIRIIDLLGGKLGIGKDKVFVNVDRYGNMASASVPVALDEAVRQNRIKRGDIVLLATFGGGLTCGSCILKW